MVERSAVAFMLRWIVPKRDNMKPYKPYRSRKIRSSILLRGTFLFFTMVSLTEQVLAEIEEAREGAPPSWSSTPLEARGECIYFNNFSSYLPFGIRRKQAEFLEGLDSPKYAVAGKTLRQFYRDIDQAIQEEGIDIGQIERLQQRVIGDIKAKGELLRLVIPVFIRLRQMGYSYEDLIR